MNATPFPAACAAVLALLATLVASGCAKTTRETVLASDALKVVATTRSTLDINISKYRHYTTYDLYVHGDKVSDAGFATLLQDPDAAAGVVHTNVVVLDENAILLASHDREGIHCWTTRLLVQTGNVVAEEIMRGSVGCSPRPGPPGWQHLHQQRGDLLLVREKPFQVHQIAGYWYPLWIEGDVVALYQEDSAREALIVRLTGISTGKRLAELALPKHMYAEPDLLHASSEARRQWLLDNFTVSVAPTPSIQLRADNRLATITPETWARYQALDSESREADARARAARDARMEAECRELREAEPARTCGAE